MRHEEWHATVIGDPIRWWNFCTDHGFKPLWIELNNFERQLMLAANRDPSEEIRINGDFAVVRLKHEIQVPANHHEPGAVYYECHVKLDGEFEPGIFMSSRDLYRNERWYATQRKLTPFNPWEYASWFAKQYPKNYVEFEYEVAVLDTNPLLDANWTQKEYGFDRCSPLTRRI